MLRIVSLAKFRIDSLPRFLKDSLKEPPLSTTSLRMPADDFISSFVRTGNPFLIKGSTLLKMPPRNDPTPNCLIKRVIRKRIKQSFRQTYPFLIKLATINLATMTSLREIIISQNVFFILPIHFSIKFCFQIIQELFLK